TAIPRLPPDAQVVYERTVEAQHAAYKRLIELLLPAAAREYYRIFPARKKTNRYDKDVKKKAQEIARYVLPVATYAYLYHTISVITLLRYWRLCRQPDCATETRFVVERMIGELLRADPQFEKVMEQPIAEEDTLEARAYAARPSGQGAAAGFVREFDRELAG